MCMDMCGVWGVCRGVRVRCGVWGGATLLKLTKRVMNGDMILDDTFSGIGAGLPRVVA